MPASLPGTTLYLWGLGDLITTEFTQAKKFLKIRPRRGSGVLEKGVQLKNRRGLAGRSCLPDPLATKTRGQDAGPRRRGWGAFPASFLEEKHDMRI